MPKITALPANTTPEYDDLVPTVETSSTTTKKATLAGVLAILYPVGTLYFNATNSTNPNALFGFGTWVSYAAGRVPVGFNSGDTDFNSAEKTGGEKTHTLTTAEIPSHFHTIPGSAGSGASSGPLDSRTGGSPSQTDVTGGGGAHNNLQPYITVYIWKRTA